jgi:hypothetical protein
MEGRRIGNLTQGQWPCHLVGPVLAALVTARTLPEACARLRGVDSSCQLLATLRSQTRGSPAAHLFAAWKGEAVDKLKDRPKLVKGPGDRSAARRVRGVSEAG